VRHHGALDVRREKDCDGLARPLAALDDRACLLEDLLVAPPGDKDASERSCNRAHRWPRAHDPLRERDGILAHLHGLAHRLDRLTSEPARPVTVVLLDQFDPFRQPGVHSLPLGSPRSC